MEKKPIYKDAERPVGERVADLLSRMTLEEKIEQMRLFEKPLQHFPGHDDSKPFTDEEIERIRPLGATIYSTDSASADFINNLQDYMLHKTRLGIPMSVHGESLHGAMNENGTVFPNPTAMAATFDDGLIGEVADAIGEEVRANGVVQTYAPNLDLTQDPRWGRCEENFGEDPYLTARMGVAYVKGLQSRGVAASPKHFSAHGMPQSGLNRAAVHCGERELRESYLYPFKKVFQEGGAMSVMPAYSEIDGIPCHSNRYLLTDILRGEWGFEGPVVSDWGGLYYLHGLHYVAKDAAEAGRMGIFAGVDMEAPNVFGFGEEFVEEVRKGNIPMELVDRAVGRILALKFRLGLFENPYAVPEDRKKECIHTRRHLDLAQRTEEEGAVLLKNENDMLPLKDGIGKIALIGPNADILQLGDYALPKATERAVTVKQALEERVGKDRVLFSRGCNIAFGTQQMHEEAVAAAKAADVAVVVLGDNSSFYNNEFWSDREDPTVRRNSVTCGETFDVDDLNLPPVQQKLLEDVFATGTPTVLVLQSGRPHSLVWAQEHIPAILEAFYAGEVGGYAIVRLLFGDVNPSGKLPWSVPRSVGQIPVYYNAKPSCGVRENMPGGSPDRAGRMYVFNTPEPLYKFGFGLSYTTFSYSDLAVDKPVCGADETVRVSVKVRNTGMRKGKETVLLYLRNRYCPVTQPKIRLRGFRKIELEPGEEKRVEFSLGREDFEYIGTDLSPCVSPGTFDVFIDKLQTEFVLQ